VVGAGEDGLRQVVFELGRRLGRNGVHEVERKALETGRSRSFECLPGLADVVSPSQGVEEARLEGLDSQGKTVDACISEAGELPGVDGSGVGLQGHLQIGAGPESPGDCPEDAVDGGRSEERGSTAAEEDSVERCRREGLALGEPVQFTQKRPGVFLLRPTLRSVGIEVAVWTAREAPGDVQIEARRERLSGGLPM
jgi:hypothetical protein